LSTPSRHILRLNGHELAGLAGAVIPILVERMTENFPGGDIYPAP
jgi:hypothetical protein